MGTIRALLESGIKPPSAIIGASVGALDGAVIAAAPDLKGATSLQQLWLSQPASDVFHIHPLGAILSQFIGRRGPLSPAPVKKLIESFETASGCTTFEDLRLPLLVVATDLDRGRPAVFRSGPLAPALLATTAIPGLFPPVRIGARDYSDGGVVDNVPIALAVREGYRRILAVGLMAGAELRDSPSSWSRVVARTLQLTLHQRLLSDFERLRRQARIVIICPVTAPQAAWDMNRSHVESLIERALQATPSLLAPERRAIVDRTAIHYIDLKEHA
ncbi:MAG: patatin-like phospholipase family protein, partial [Solirubrobacterales bacterium]